MSDKVTPFGGLELFVGRRFFLIDGRAVTPAQLVFHHYRWA